MDAALRGEIITMPEPIEPKPHPRERRDYGTAAMMRDWGVAIAIKAKRAEERRRKNLRRNGYATTEAQRVTG